MWEKPLETDITDARELFTSAREWNHPDDQKLTRHIDNGRAYCQIGHHDGFPFSLLVELADPSKEVIADMRTIVDGGGRFYFEIIIHDDDTATVYAKWNDILGSRRVAEITQESLRELIA